jgi:hypothetical protein
MLNHQEADQETDEDGQVGPQVEVPVRCSLEELMMGATKRVPLPPKCTASGLEDPLVVEVSIFCSSSDMGFSLSFFRCFFGIGRVDFEAWGCVS